jgi:NAD(P)-dependent dehydrogenase (short-subunit alcohol dehydrogenase family)
VTGTTTDSKENPMSKPLMCDKSLFLLDLSGKTYVVTGANSGIGKVTAEQLAKQGATVVLACRNTAAGEEAKAEIVAALPRANVEVIPLDLGSLESVRKFASAFTQRHQRLDGLVNNAGVMNPPKGTTQDGFETQFGTNHLGHFYLTELLLDTLKSTPGSRIVNLSSCYHDKAMGREGKIHFEDLNYESRKYDGWEAYAQSKLANLLHAQELSRRLEGTGVTAVSVHPGWVRTNLVRHSVPVFLQNAASFVLRLAGMVEPWEGAQTTLFALLGPEVPSQSGAYFSQTGMYRVRSANRGGWPLVSPNPEVTKPGVAARLWSESERLIRSRVQA